MKKHDVKVNIVTNELPNNKSPPVTLGNVRWTINNFQSKTTSKKGVYQMGNRRSFTKEFKRKIVEEILSGTTTRTALSRKYNIAEVVLYRWKKSYADGKLDNELSAGVYHQKEKIAQLERMVGHLSMENEILKKALGSV